MQNAREWFPSTGVHATPQPVVMVIADTDGTIVFDSQNWNAHQVYFRAPQGNILELIARHELLNASQAEFSRRSFLNISEIGLTCDDVPSLVQ